MSIIPIRRTAKDAQVGRVQIAKVEVEVNRIRTKVMATTKVIMVQTMRWDLPIAIGEPQMQSPLVLLNSRVRLQTPGAICYTRVSRAHTLQHG